MGSSEKLWQLLKNIIYKVQVTVTDVKEVKQLLEELLEEIKENRPLWSHHIVLGLNYFQRKVRKAVFSCVDENHSDGSTPDMPHGGDKNLGKDLGTTCVDENSDGSTPDMPHGGDKDLGTTSGNAPPLEEGIPQDLADSLDALINRLKLSLAESADL